ncbi:MAG: hypothetical protein MJK10_12935 [Pseudomonadales bacterium]|nr:hypothetical protein [Pseudomonadales bacterium]NRA16910.1 hypothetical protein [Oceanospirillaceae bacterium]
MGYVPAINIDGQLFSESVAIIECLEELQPNKRLFPECAFARARVREVCEYVNSTIHPAQNRTILNYLRSQLDNLTKKQLRADWISLNLGKLQQRLWVQS